MADNNRQQESQMGTGTAEAARRGTTAAGTTAQAAGDALRQGTQASTEAVEQTSQATANLLRRGGEATAETVRRSGQASAEVIRRTDESVRQGAEAAAEGGRRLAQAVQSGTEEMQRWMVLPNTANGGLQEMQQALSGLVEGVIRTNLHITQELFRLANPSGVIQLQQRFAREYFDALAAAQATMLCAARRTTEEALRPVEQQRRGGRQGADQGSQQR